MTVLRAQITGLVLAGGRGSRMGGVDKGLQPLRGRPLVAHALERLAPQVGPLLISANRNLDDYRRFGPPVLTDAQADFPGPLAGLLAGLRACSTPWLLAVPCDAPQLPADLAARLGAALGPTDDLALPRSADGRLQPTFCLLRAGLADRLAAFLDGGERKMERWMLAQRHALACFERPGDQAAFLNLNRSEELRQLEHDE
ncbi:MAG TPA: molybdenum cofactor guanylyltransferase MobA [Roseateles sp.]|nr:molybdenum cofactor guanylyltransferase MobA [Roseateles sp.]